MTVPVADSTLVACPHCGTRLPVGASPKLPLTLRQREILDFIGDSIRSRGVAPTFDEIANQFGYRSLGGVYEHLTHLQAKGWIVRQYNKSRAIELVAA